MRARTLYALGQRKSSYFDSFYDRGRRKNVLLGHVNIQGFMFLPLSSPMALLSDCALRSKLDFFCVLFCWTVCFANNVMERHTDPTSSHIMYGSMSHDICCRRYMVSVSKLYARVCFQSFSICVEIICATLPAAVQLKHT